MPTKAAGLTDRKVKTHSSPGMLADGGGLYLQVAKGGAKSWILRFQVRARRRDMGLGSVEKVSLSAARSKAKIAQGLVGRGIDPIEHKKAAAAAAAVELAKGVTFKQAAKAYIEHMRGGWRNAKHAGQWSSTLEAHAYPILGHLPVGAIDTALVCQVLDPIWRTKTETASRVRGRIESILDHAKVRGQRAGESSGLMEGTGNDDTAGWRFRFKTGDNIDSVSTEIVSIYDDPYFRPLGTRYQIPGPQRCETADQADGGWTL